MPMRAYVAGPLFTPDERRRLVEVAAAVEAAGHTAVLPFDPDAFEVGGDRAAAFAQCLDALRTVDAVVAVLDGVDADSGTAFEVGYARARGLPVLGVRTDYRTLGEEGAVNLMLERGVTRLVTVDDWDAFPDAVAAFLDAPGGDAAPRLVRDKEPSLRRSAGEAVEVRKVEGDAYATHLKRYLVQAAEGLVASDDAAEEKDHVADLLEGVEALIRHRAYAKDAIRRAKARREDEYGGLDLGYVLGRAPHKQPPTKE